LRFLGYEWGPNNEPGGWWVAGPLAFGGLAPLAIWLYVDVLAPLAGWIGRRLNR
jgi:hypothetical protein